VVAPDASDLVLGDGFEELAAVDALCIDAARQDDVGSFSVPDPPEDMVGRVFAMLGFAVVTEDCPATLSIRVAAHATSAEYTYVVDSQISTEIVRTCWNGFFRESEVVLSDDGGEIRSWVSVEERKPPFQLSESECFSDPLSIEVGVWEDLVARAAFDIFGSDGLAASLIYLDGFRSHFGWGHKDVWEGDLALALGDEGMVMLVVSMLYSDDYETSIAAALSLYSLADGRDASRLGFQAPYGLTATVPHLVAFGKGSDDPDVLDAVHAALERITGVPDGDLDAAWVWWEEQQP
jgi:hypothetical protein